MTMAKMLNFWYWALIGGLMALSSIFVVTNSLLLRLHGGPEKKRKNNFAKKSQVPAAPIQ